MKLPSIPALQGKKTFLGIGLMVLAIALNKFMGGGEKVVSADDLQEVYDAGLAIWPQVMHFIGMILAVYGRLRARGPILKGDIPRAIPVDKASIVALLLVPLLLFMPSCSTAGTSSGPISGPMRQIAGAAGIRWTPGEVALYIKTGRLFRSDEDVVERPFSYGSTPDSGK